MCVCDQVLSIEKAESSSPLPYPVIVSVRSKKAFQFIELPDRDDLVDSLNDRLRALQWKHSMYANKPARKPLVLTHTHTQRAVSIAGANVLGIEHSII